MKKRKPPFTSKPMRDIAGPSGVFAPNSTVKWIQSTNAGGLLSFAPAVRSVPLAVSTHAVPSTVRLFGFFGVNAISTRVGYVRSVAIWSYT